ncbi:VanW family protein, partial [Patescibacteria group bacterium]|nr:VanW family protein [Patescibacteria group bacterium]
YGLATISAKAINFGYDSKLLSYQAFSVGRSSNSLSNLSLIAQTYLNGVYLQPSYTYSETKLRELISPLVIQLEKKPVNAQFKFENGRVTSFRPATDGQTIDFKELSNRISLKIAPIVLSGKPQEIIINVPIKIIPPEVTNEKVNNMGIKEQIGEGTSLFQHSIPRRIFNVTLASARLNGILIAPNEIFSFNKALGDVSAFTGYQQAYVIQNGRTVLGDGGGVCQVSTTFYRAALNSGLPIVERTAHAYRVGYYEQDSGPGIDSTVYSPSVDLKFKNDTGHYILVQTAIDPTVLRLTVTFYGTSDGRVATVTTPVIVSQTPPPPAIYQDDPTLPKGEVRQVDFAAWGANVYFTRTVVRNGQTLISEKISSNFRAWQDIFLKGTKE